MENFLEKKRKRKINEWLLKLYSLVIVIIWIVRDYKSQTSMMNECGHSVDCYNNMSATQSREKDKEKSN